MQTGAAIRRGEHRRDPSLNAKSPAQALRSAKRALYAGAAVSTVAAATVPILPLVSISATLLQVAGAYWCQRRLNQQREAIAELAKPRGFWFDDHFAPAKRGEDGSILNQGQWIADWVPFEAKQIDDVYEGTKVTRWRKVLFLEQDWKQVLDDQQSWLTTHWPAGFQAVVGWWSAHYVHRLLTWRHGAGPWTPEQEQAAGSALEADLRIGIAIAGRPHLWKRSLGMGKEAKIYRDLVRRLDEASLPKGLPGIPGQNLPDPQGILHRTRLHLGPAPSPGV